MYAFSVDVLSFYVFFCFVSVVHSILMAFVLLHISTYIYETQYVNIQPHSLVVYLGSTGQPHYNASHYSAVFNITQSCHGSQINYFAICLL